MEIIVKSFTPHYNRALGKVITSERQYKDEMKRGGYISYDECKDRVNNNLKKQREWNVPNDVKAWCKEVWEQGDSKGRVKLSDRQIDALKTKGMASASKAPKGTPTTGGIQGD